MKQTTKLILVLLFSLLLSLLSGCGFMVIEVTLTPTPQTPTETPSPATTLTGVPSKTPSPTSTSTPDAPLSADGPWLVYHRHYKRAADGQRVEDFTFMNSDGSGESVIRPFECDVTGFLVNEEGAATYMLETEWPHSLLLFRPEQASGCFIVHRDVRYWGIGAAFLPQEKGGLLAGIYWTKKDASPELIVYELPAGTIRARLPLVQCLEEEKGCQGNHNLFDDITHQGLMWSPNGRYLAFAAVRDGISSDLYVLDSQDGSLHQLTSGPDWVGGIWWSPDGSQILMEEIIIPWENEQDRQENFYRRKVIPSSLWSVSVSDNRLRRLYSIENGGGCCTNGSAYYIDGPWMWLDDKRFLIYEGEIRNFNVGLARNLRLVDTGSGKTRKLVDFSFYDIDLDEVHEVFAVSLQYSIDKEYEEGVYLVPLKNSPIRYLDLTANINWDEKTGLFVSTSSCKDDPQKVRAFNYLGEFSCVLPPSEPTPPTSYPAPNGQLEISVQNGLWLKAKGQSALRVISPETASNVIWCPDSSCFFFVVGREEDHPYLELYHVSLPDLTINLLKKGILSVMEYKLLQEEDSQP